MFFGNKDLSFFGQLQLEVDISLLPVFRNQVGKLFLRAGTAHGIDKGSDYALYPSTAVEELLDLSKEPYVFARAAGLNSLTSELKGEEDRPLPTYIELGWKVRPLTLF
jgi:hypothetical protein